MDVLITTPESRVVTIHESKKNCEEFHRKKITKAQKQRYFCELINHEMEGTSWHSTPAPAPPGYTLLSWWMWLFIESLSFSFTFLPAAKPTGLVEASYVLSFFFFLPPFGPKRVKTAQTNMVAYVVWDINFKSDFRIDLRGCLEAVLASKPHFLCWSQNDGSS